MFFVHLVILLAIGGVSSPDSTLYRQVLIRDLTGDGVPDTITLVVTGPSLDSGLAHVEIRSGTLLYRDSWVTDRYAGEGVGPFASSEQRRAFIQRELAHAVTIQPMTQEHLMEARPTDRDELRAVANVVRLYKGYENSKLIAWSARRRAFITIWGCC